MFKLILISTLCLTAFGFDHCWKNLGNARQSINPIWSILNTTYSLEDCKDKCDQWTEICGTYEEVMDACDRVHCNAGVLTDVGCDLYQESDLWYTHSDDSRDQAFDKCDASCWLDHNGQEHIEEDVVILALEGEYSIPNCQSECVNYNVDCEEVGCEVWCGGVTSSDVECILTTRFDLESGLTYSNNENSHYREYTCEIDKNPETEEASTHIITPDDDDDEELLPEDEDPEIHDEEGDDDDEGEIDGNFGSEIGSDECTQAIVYSECDYQGESAVVNLVVNELDWEPKSWCVPEHQTLVLHDEFYLEGNDASYTESVACAEIIDYSFLQMTQPKKVATTPTHSVRTF